MPPDHGPIYLETDFSRFPVEPWATYSQLLFLVVILYWTWRLLREPEGFRRQRFIAWCLPLLLLQYLGATIYHAARSHLFWMLLDVLPLYALCLLAAGHLWRRAGLSWAGTLALVLAPPLLGNGLNRALPLPGYLGMALVYAGYFLAIFLPAFAARSLVPANRRFLPWAALAALSLALFFRSVDHAADFLPMGTHWLWHAMGAAGVHLLVWYVYVLDGNRART